MNRRGNVVALTLLATLVPLGALSFAARDRIEDRVLGFRSEALPVVHTGEELARCRPIAFGRGLTARLGVSTDEVPPFGPALVYLLLEGTEGRNPLDVRVRVPGSPEEPEAEEPSRIDGCLLAPEPPRVSLFTVPVVLPREGEFEVSVRDSTKRVIARRTLRVLGVGAQPWFGFGELSECGADGCAPVGPSWTGLGYRPSADVVVPALAGAPRDGTEFDRSAPLPSSVEWTEVKPTLTLAHESGDDRRAYLVVRGPGLQLVELMDPFSFAVRLWLNGRAITSVGAVSEPTRARNAWIKPIEPGSREGALASMHVHVADLGARTGDRVAAQLVFAPRGPLQVVTVGPAPASWRGGAALSSAPTPLLTNRVEWVVP